MTAPVGRPAGLRRTIDYNQLDLPASISWENPTQRTTFGYDAGGARVLKKDAAQTVSYVPGLFERRVITGDEIQNLHNIIVVDGRLIAQINLVQTSPDGPIATTRPWYVNTDQQGSTSVITNPSGRRVGNGDDDWLREMFYDPFGQRLDADSVVLGHQRRGGPHQGFTGHESDDETGLVNTGGRIYDPQARSFLTPDPLMQDPLNSQNHDRYSYAWNNPTTLTDPSGYSVADAVTPTFLQAACLGGASMDCWEFSAMHMIGWAIGGVNNYLNLVFSNIPTPGFDEDSTSASSPARAPSFDCDAACHRTLEAGDYPIADGRVWDPHGEVISMRGTTADREDEEFDSDAITRAELWKNWLAQFATHVQEQAAKSANSSNTRPLNVTYGVTGEAVSPRDGWGQGSPNVGVGWTPCPATRRPGSMSTGVPSTSPAH